MKKHMGPKKLKYQAKFSKSINIIVLLCSTTNYSYGL